MGSTGKCLCNDGFYDDSSNELCGTCHYSWLLIHFFLINNSVTCTGGDT